jgi:Outer membrane lipoprotein-sorting protein
MKKAINLLTYLLLLLPVSAQLPDADQIMNKSRELTLIGSMQATISLIITEKNGATRNRSIAMTTKSFPDGLEKRFIKFLDPADVRGTAMLIVDNKDASDEIWIYLPALKKTRRISASENAKSFMSSEFTNADMGSPTLSDFRSRHLDGSGTNNTWIIESVPINDDKADEYGYTKKVSYLNMDTYQVRKMDFYNFDGELFKTIEIRSVHSLPEGKYMVTDMIANNLVTKRRSEITFSNIQDMVRVEDSYFSVQNLER